MREKIVLIGAGSAVFTKGLIADFIARGEELTIGLVDVNGDALEVAEGLATRMIESKGAPINIEASVDRRSVLPGATAVICTVGVGGRRAWTQDVEIPRQYGIYQPVGDTIMPGGLSRALRMVPAMIAIAEDVSDLCDDALFFNYSNPMSAVCRGVRKATGANIVGLCHGVNHVGHFLARTLEVDPGDVAYTAVGLNHLTWFTELRANGHDMMPALSRYCDRTLGELFDSDGAARDEATENGRSPFSWQLFESFGAFPAVLDRHVCEFFPSFFAAEGSYYGKTLGTDCYSFERTIEHGDQSFEEMGRIARGEEDVPEEFFSRASGEHEQVLEIIDSIRTDAGAIFSANLPNTGQIENLPSNSIIETPAVARGSGIQAIHQGPLEPGIAGTLARPIAAIETIVDAAIEGSREKFVQALIIDGSVSSHHVAESLADDLLEAHKEWLPTFERQDA